MSQQIIGILNPLLALIFGLAFVIFWFVQKERTYILFIAFAYFAFSCGIFISNVGVSAQDLLHVLGTHMFYSIALSCLVLALSKRNQTPPRISLILTIAIGITPLLIWLHSNSDLANLRVIVANVAYSSLFFLGAHNLWQSRKNNGFEYWLFVLINLMAIQGLVRPVAIFWLDAKYHRTIFFDAKV